MNNPMKKSLFKNSKSGATYMRRISRLVPALALGSTVALGGCSVLDDLLAVDAPSRVVASDLENPAAAPLLVASVANEFRCALTHYISGSALVGMEWDDASANTINAIWDTRNHDTSGYGAQYASTDCGSGNAALYLPLSRSRWYGDQVLTNLGTWDVGDVPDKAAFTAETSVWTGYSYLLLGESMCEVAFDGEAKQSYTAAFSLAIARFDAAISAGGTADITNLAKVGKARAQLNLGEVSAAGATAAGVSADFSYKLSYSDAENVTRNKQWEANHRDDEVTIGTTYRGLSYGGVIDPRAAVTDKGVQGQAGIDVWTADKYPEASSQIEVGSWEEAQLIVAEAAIAAGNLDAARSIFDVLHTNAGLPTFTSVNAAPTAGELTTQLTYERSVEMFLEGHHLWDVKRLSIPLVPANGAASPFGTFYSNELCFELPAVEFLNNDNIPSG
jgi:hypothetical protein